MTTQPWLPLTDYSTKYKVSISTLRRRIKTEKIQFRFEDGKYFLLDTPIERHGPEDFEVGSSSEAPSAAASGQAPVVFDLQPVIETTNRMLEELKRAYMLILQEKEEQTLQLKQEIADLRTLVRVLENENQRLNDLLQKGEGKSTRDLPPTFY